MMAEDSLPSFLFANVQQIQRFWMDGHPIGNNRSQLFGCEDGVPEAQAKLNYWGAAVLRPYNGIDVNWCAREKNPG
jgi:hypothetical protein